MKEWFAVALGGMIGSVIRHGINRGLVAYLMPAIPVTTLIANVVGCFAIGFLYQSANRFDWLQGDAAAFWKVGLLGGLTTFSSFSLEVCDAFQSEKYSLGCALFVGNLVLGLSVTVMGIYLAAKLFPGTDIAG